MDDSQCGFRCNRGCTDMIFYACQLIEKTTEHDTKAFLLLLTYNSVPRDVMWLILAKYGVPEIDLVRSFHVDMQTERFISKSGCAMRVMKLIKVDWLIVLQ